MGLFRANFDRPGPGIPKDAPKKKGLRLFFDIFFRAFWELIKLNLLFLLFCIPVVTIGPACAGMSKVTMLMMREKPFFVFQDFWDAFRQNWKQGFLGGLLLAAVIAAAGFSLPFYMQTAQENAAGYLLVFLVAAVLMIIGLATVYLFPMIVTFAFPFPVVLRNCLLLGLVCLKQSLPALLVIGGLGLVLLLLFPLNLPLLLFFYFAFASFVSSFAAWPGMERYVVKTES